MPKGGCQIDLSKHTCIREVRQQIIDNRSLIMFSLQSFIERFRIDANTQLTRLLNSHNNLTNPLGRFNNRSNDLETFQPLQFHLKLFTNSDRNFPRWKNNRLGVRINLEMHFSRKNSKALVKNIRELIYQVPLTFSTTFTKFS